ncbi:M20 metallopeptidase family protein [Halalkalibacter akibai]|uniref:N-acyl-L-amino acid amidohydrolase n=1 Tax=Halalkalibacter akibai (strain ATCC 43226 / DSM 21942 / CIP 109018 / JCM 9157 / 1139) TaxID=1236973 RepID=W4QRT6_HALA3|nr:amidohydrolase [Halalkalibacter akibai]GAE34642.1 N-acyl-L-amino acid amidohydrolase [Halalkalibacter akibai JCM 9157]
MNWLEQLQKWRRQLHREPELSFQETKTTNYIIEQLQDLTGVQLLYGVDQIGLNTGVVAIVGNGSSPVVGLRADIDALPITEQTGLSFRSKHDGIMHACGHDGHTAMLIGAVRQLSELSQSGKLTGTVKCLFQPAEEMEDTKGKTGAQYVLESGVLADLEAIIAIHLDPEIPLKSVKLKSGLVMANVDTFKINISGSGGHGAYPEQAVDPIWLSSLTLPYLYSIPSRRIKAEDPSVLSICQITGGSQANVIPSEVTISGTIRTYSDQARNQIVYEIEKGLRSVGELGGSFDFFIHHGEPALLNDPVLTGELRSLLENLNEEINIFEETYGMGGEDFSHITRQIPGVMIFLGAKEKETSLHQPTFNI